MTMDISHFQKTYQNLSDNELIEIVSSKARYVIDARMAAIHVLKERNIQLPEENSIEKEYNHALENEKKELLNEKLVHTNLINRLSNIPPGQKAAIAQSRWGWVEVKRLTNTKFKIRQADYWQGWMAPVLILIVKPKSKLITYPLFNFRSLLLSVIISILFLLIPLVDTDNNTPWYLPMLFPIGLMLIVQIILLPLMYYKLLDLVKNKFGK